MEFALVFGFFWLPYTLIAVERYWNPLRAAQGSSWQAIVGSGWTQVVTAAFEPLLVLWIVALHKGGIGTISRRARWSDLVVGLGLYVLQMVAYYAAALVIGRDSPQTVSGNLIIMMERLPLTILLLRSTFTSLGEEVVMRAFLQTRLTQLGWSSMATVTVSAFLQASYHVYQGVHAAVLSFPFFLIAALFYQRQRRLLPVWFAHWAADMVSILLWSHRAHHG